MATIYEVSKLAGVSLATVSRVMNGTAKVSARTEEKVKNAMQELGYTPNSVAISLASKRSNCVGILVAELDGVFFGDMMKAIEKELRTYNKHVVITAGHGRIEDEQQGIRFLESRNCDAIILHAEELQDDYLIALHKGKTPIFVMNRYIPQMADHCISLDNVHGGFLAAQNVLDQGHKDIALISGPMSKIDARKRIEGCKKALDEKGVSLPEKNIYEGNYLEESGVEAIDYFMRENIHFTALICGNDQMAIGAMARLREYGKVPAEDVSVIGFDDVSIASCTFPRLTTVKYPIAEMGKVAADLVLSQVYKVDKQNISNRFEPTLIVRDSVQKAH